MLAGGSHVGDKDKSYHISYLTRVIQAARVGVATQIKALPSSLPPLPLQTSIQQFS
jgi:hypothetical protein